MPHIPVKEWEALIFWTQVVYRDCGYQNSSREHACHRAPRRPEDYDPVGGGPLSNLKDAVCAAIAAAQPDTAEAP